MRVLKVKAPQWFKERPEDSAKCIYYPAESGYDPFFKADDLLDDTAGTPHLRTGYEEEAKAVCTGKFDNRVCPLLEQCLEFALENNERFGIWGGTTPAEREKIRKSRRYDY